MITTTADLLEISRVLCPSKLPSSFSNRSDVTGKAIRNSGNDHPTVWNVLMCAS